MYQALSETEKQSLLSAWKKDKSKDTENVILISSASPQITNGIQTVEVSADEFQKAQILIV